MSQSLYLGRSTTNFVEELKTIFYLEVLPSARRDLLNLWINNYTASLSVCLHNSGRYRFQPSWARYPRLKSRLAPVFVIYNAQIYASYIEILCYYQLIQKFTSYDGLMDIVQHVTARMNFTLIPFDLKNHPGEDQSV